MRTIKHILVTLLMLFILVSCDVGFYDYRYNYDNITHSVLVGKWYNENYSSVYREIDLYSNGTYVIYLQSYSRKTFVRGHWFFNKTDGTLYLNGDIREKMVIYRFEYPQLYFTDRNVWRKIRMEDC